jgi:hypothetical protein
MTAQGKPVVMLQLAQPVVAALALARVRQAPAAGSRERSGTVGDARFQLRGVRPTLTFPAPDRARLGLAIEGGVYLPTGRILTLDAFVTATAPVEMSHDAAGWLPQLPLTALELGEVRLSYAGRDLPPDDQRAAQGLPAEADLAPLRAALADEICAFCADLPALLLALPFAAPDLALHAHITPEDGGAALTLAATPADTADIAWPGTTRPPQTVALLINGDAFAAAFASVAREQIPRLIAPELGLIALNGTCAQDRLWFAAQARANLDDQPDARLDATLEALVQWEADHLRLAVERVAVESPPGGEATAQALGKALASDIFCDRLADLTQRAFQAAVAPAFEPALDDLTWRWAAPEERGQPALTFAPTHAHVKDGYLTLLGAVALPAAGTVIDDLPDFDLRVVGAPEPLDGGPATLVRVSATHPRNAAPPCDYAWWNATTGTPLAQHTSALEVILHATQDDPADTLPHDFTGVATTTDQIALRAALINTLGRVAEAVIDVDLSALTRPLAEVPPAAFAASAVTASTRAALTGAQTRFGTAYQPTVRQAQARSSLQGMLAGALAAFAIISVLTAFLLTNSHAAPNSTTASVAPTATTAIQITPLPPTATPHPHTAHTPVPTTTPEVYGRFAAAPNPLVLTCVAAATPTPAPTDTSTPAPAPTVTPTPGVLTLTNTGNAQISWQAITYITTGAGTSQQAWATLAPTSGDLAPGGSVTITITPAPAFCTGAAGTYIIQFTATAGLAVPLNVTATHS